jgi:hypothetical protein
MTCISSQAFSAERASDRVRLGGGGRKNLLVSRTDSVQLFTVNEVRVVSWPTGLIARCSRRDSSFALVKITKETDAKSKRTRERAGTGTERDPAQSS